MKPKYQIFVSSTYEDLTREREIVIKAVLEMGHIPVGMEMFSAGDEQQWELIKRQIDDCDYYLVIIAHRYGSTDGRTSYTEKEYDYAIANKVPTLGFIIEDRAPWPKSLIDAEPLSQQALASFKEKVKAKIVSFWKGADDLNAKIAVSLSKAVAAYPRPGWIRATEAAAPDVMNELSRLSKENAELRTVKATLDFRNKVQGEEQCTKVIALLKKNITETALRFVGDSDWTDGPSLSLAALFQIVAPRLMVEQSVIEITAYLALMLQGNTTPEKNLPHQWPMPVNAISSWLADFSALELVKPSPKKHQVKDKNEYWCITEFGRRVYTSMRISALTEGKEYRYLRMSNINSLEGFQDERNIRSKVLTRGKRKSSKIAKQKE